MAPTFVNDAVMVEGKPDKKSVVSNSNTLKLHVTQNNLIAAQKYDFTLHKCFSSVVSPEGAQERKKLLFAWRMEY